LFVVLDAAGVNLALGKPASQTSTYGGAPASSAVDGSLNTGSCTYSHVHPWLSVDLGAQYDVGHVTVTHDTNIGWGNVTWATEQLGDRQTISVADDSAIAAQGYLPTGRKTTGRQLIGKSCTRMDFTKCVL